jgi:hypothetical protein
MLIECIECGNQVSDTVSRCPHCKGNPKPVECKICKQHLPESQSTNGGWSATFYYHPICLNLVKERDFALPESLRCPECGNDVRYLWAGADLENPCAGKCDAPKACSKCGFSLRDWYIYNVLGLSTYYSMDWAERPIWKVYFLHCRNCGLNVYPGLYGPTKPTDSLHSVCRRYLIEPESKTSAKGGCTTMLVMFSLALFSLYYLLHS